MEDSTMGMHKSGGTKARGRTAQTPAEGQHGVNPTHKISPQEVRRDTNRPQSAGGGRKRGDRRDTHPIGRKGKVGGNSW
jgi:hypothetical protein